VTAGYYDRAAEFFMSPSDPRAAAIRNSFRATMREAYGVGPESVPYEGAELPVYDLRPVSAHGDPILVFGGFDSYIEEFFPLLFALAGTGRRVIAFEGPGQGAALQDGDLAMTPDWGPCVTTVLDHFRTHEVTAIGISLGGALVMRAAAVEPRLARVVAFDVCDDQLDTATDRLGAAGAVLQTLLRLRARGMVNASARAASSRQPYLGWALQQGMHVTGTGSPYHFLRAAATMQTRTCSADVRADVLLLAGDEDHLIPRRMLARQAATLTSARSITTRLFTAQEHASHHCQIGNIGLAGDVILQWISQHENSN
jgi:alpha-beta hydrolase superfamily lysophospholipase